MNLKFKSSFAKDLKKVNDDRLMRHISTIIELVEQAQNISQMENIRKLRGNDRYYRIKIGDYRIGLMLEDDTVIFVRFLHRKDIYRYFP